MERFQTIDVFTPTSPARLSFVDRIKINDRLVDALRQPGMQIVVYGTSGCGKTTLLVNKLAQVYEEHIIVRCSSVTTLEMLLLAAFDQLNKYYVSEATTSQGTTLGGGLGTSYASIRAQMMVPPQLTESKLAEFLGDAKCCLVLEDFHKVSEGEKAKLSQTMKIFMDTAHDYPMVKIVAIGAADKAREVIEYDTEMRGRVTEILVPLMTQEEISEIIEKGSGLLNLSVPPSMKNAIAKYSNGMASVAHQLTLNICNSIGIVETMDDTVIIGPKELQAALERYVENSSDTLKAVFSRALRTKKKSKYENSRVIVKALSRLPLDGATHNDILKEIQSEIPEYPPSNLTVYLRELRTEDRGELIRYDSYSNKFAFSEPMFSVYAKCLFQESATEGEITIEDALQIDVGKLVRDRIAALSKSTPEAL
jgi:GTPase SAR1 family protein